MNYRDLALEAVDAGLVDRHELLIMCLKYMTQDEVANMLEANELKRWLISELRADAIHVGCFAED